MSVSLSISLLFQISERKWGGTWSHESCGVCNSCEGGNYINSVYMLVGCSGLYSNCSFTRLHSYFVSPAGMDDFSCGWAGRRSGWGWGMPWSRVLWLLWPGLGLWLWQISSIWIKSSALYAAGSKVMCHCWGVISPLPGGSLSRNWWYLLYYAGKQLICYCCDIFKIYSAVL